MGKPDGTRDFGNVFISTQAMADLDLTDSDQPGLERNTQSGFKLPPQAALGALYTNSDIRQLVLGPD
jgi:hypothetical protein